MITVRDIFQQAKIVAASNNNFITMYLLLAVLYWSICFVFEQVQHYLERRYTVKETPISFQSFS